MDITEVLKLVDELLFAHTGNRLDSLQETILKGTWQGQKYSKIASENHLSEGHVRDTASELWQKLSDILGEDINKLNARNILEKFLISNNGSIGYFVGCSQVNICSERTGSPKSSAISKLTENKPYLVLFCHSRQKKIRIHSHSSSERRDLGKSSLMPLIDPSL